MLEYYCSILKKARKTLVNKLANIYSTSGQLWATAQRGGDSRRRRPKTCQQSKRSAAKKVRGGQILSDFVKHNHTKGRGLAGTGNGTQREGS